jgi:F420-0:gamma-glutamyl ligase-like protein
MNKPFFLLLAGAIMVAMVVVVGIIDSGDDAVLSQVDKVAAEIVVIDKEQIKPVIFSMTISNYLQRYLWMTKAY